MRLVFLGTPELAVPILVAVAARHEVAAVVCQPDRPQGRSKEPVPPPTKVWALEHGIPCVQPTVLNDGVFETWLRDQHPEVCVLVAYGRLLKPPLLDVPPLGFINVHPSLLPRYRGASPIQTALLEGVPTTGVTLMRLDAGMDTGDILLQEPLAVHADDTVETLSARLANAGAVLLLKGLDLLASGRAVFTPQDHSRATVTRPFEKRDGEIHWSSSASAIHSLVRATNPWPGAHCLFRGQVCRIHKTEVIPNPAQAGPGTVVRVERDRIVVATGDGKLAILGFQMPGKRAMSMADFLRGHPVTVGERFEEL